MRRRLSVRLFSIACGLWLITAQAEPAAMHDCPMHGAHGGDHSHAAAMADGAADGAHSSHEHHHRIRACTCVGACCIAVAAAAPEPAAVRAFEAQPQQTSVVAPLASEYRPTTIEYARPPTIGPPHTTA